MVSRTEALAKIVLFQILRAGEQTYRHMHVESAQIELLLLVVGNKAQVVLEKEQLKCASRP